MKSFRWSHAFGLFAAFLVPSIGACGGSVEIPAAPDDASDGSSGDTGTSGETSGGDTGTSPDTSVPGDSADTTPPGDTPTPDVPPTCTAPKKDCGGTCVDPATDPANCGDCGIACTGGLTCESGKCICGAGKITCGTACVDVSTDPANCGGCGKACPTGAPCASGICGPCPTGKTLCGTGPGTCSDTSTDPLNCGACGKKCPLGGSCTAGVCACPAGQIICGGACVDVSTDTANCGGCGKACPSSATCTSGVCTCPVAKPTACGGVCSDTTSDTLNCGACFNACPTGASCTSGKCVCPVAKPDTCFGACVDRSTDPNNCGTCGTFCGGGTCVAGSCSCASPLTKCGSTCVDTTKDPSNCGSCGTKCTGLCVASVCATPKCKTAAPNVLFYGPTGESEKGYLPTGSTSTTVTAAVWATMKTADFAKYDLIIFGEPSGGGPTYANLQTAYDTRATWGAAINGRVVVTGLDAAYHAPFGTSPGAAVFLKATLSWLATGPTGSTALYVSSDWGRRGLDFLQPLGLFVSAAFTSDAITITGSHPILTGSTSSSLSNWSQSAHSRLTSIPTTFTSVATTGGTTVIAPRDVACTP